MVLGILELNVAPPVVKLNQLTPSVDFWIANGAYICWEEIRRVGVKTVKLATNETSTLVSWVKVYIEAPSL